MRVPALAPALGLVAGIGIGPAIDGPAAELWIASGLAGLLLSRLSRGSTRGGLLALALALLGAGASEVQRREHHLRNGELLGSAHPSRLHLTGNVIATPERNGRGEYALLLRVRAEQRPTFEEGTVLLRLPTPEHDRERIEGLRAGSRVRVWARLSRATPGERDALARRLLASGLDAIGRVKTSRVVEIGSAKTGVHPLDGLKRRARARLDLLLGREGPRRALAGAMLLGDREAIEPALRRTLRDAGLLHLVAISGLHVGLLLWMFHLMIGRRLVAPWLQFFVLAATLCCFALSVGPRPSVLRACLAGGLVLLGRCSGREGHAFNGWLLLGGGLLALNPALLDQPGFQLTFLASAGILLHAPRIADRLFGPRALRESIAVSVGAYSATAPLVAWHFGHVAPIGLVTGLLAIPCCGVLLSAGYASVLLGDLLPQFGTALAPLLAAAAEGLLVLARHGAGLDAGSFFVPVPERSALIAYYAVWAACLIDEQPIAWQRGMALLSLLGLIGLHIGPPPSRPKDRERLATIDVGQGLALAIIGPRGRTGLIDAGGSHDPRYDPGERRVLPYLIRVAGRRLDGMVLTHDHLDHVGGAYAVLRELEVGQLWLPPEAPKSPRLRELARIARERGSAIRIAEAGAAGTLGGLPFRVLAPARESDRTSRNDGSVVVIVGLQRPRILVPGDVERRGERSLLERAESLRAEALVVAHHGSRSGSSAPFLDAVGAEWALVSSGRRNPFGHPHRETIDRLTRSGATILRTDRSGTLELAAESGRWIRPRTAGQE